MNKIKNFFTGDRLFIDKYALTVVCAVIILLSLPVSAYAAYEADYGYLMIMPSFLTVLAVTYLQEALFIKIRNRPVQIILSALKYGFAAAWAIYCIFPLTERFRFLLEEGQWSYDGGLCVFLICGFSALALSFTVAFVLETTVLYGYKSRKSTFLLMNKPVVLFSYALIALCVIIYQIAIYNGISVHSAGGYPLLIAVPAAIGIAVITAVQEIIFLFCKNCCLHKIICVLKWTAAIGWLCFTGSFSLVIFTPLIFILAVTVAACAFSAVKEFNAIG